MSQLLQLRLRTSSTIRLYYYNPVAGRRDYSKSKKDMKKIIQNLFQPKDKVKDKDKSENRASSVTLSSHNKDMPVSPFTPTGLPTSASGPVSRSPTKPQPKPLPRFSAVQGKNIKSTGQQQQLKPPPPPRMPPQGFDTSINNKLKNRPDNNKVVSNGQTINLLVNTIKSPPTSNLVIENMTNSKNTTTADDDDCQLETETGLHIFTKKAAPSIGKATLESSIPSTGSSGDQLPGDGNNFENNEPRYNSLEFALMRQAEDNEDLMFASFDVPQGSRNTFHVPLYDCEYTAQCYQRDEVTPERMEYYSLQREWRNEIVLDQLPAAKDWRGALIYFIKTHALSDATMTKKEYLDRIDLVQQLSPAYTAKPAFLSQKHSQKLSIDAVDRYLDAVEEHL